MADDKLKSVIMVLKVDLQCTRCYKKVKKVLCKFPQIRDQAYDEKQNAVIIKVVCCNPEKLRDKICCKGCGTIKSIEIRDPPAPPKPKDPPPAKPAEKPKDPPPAKPVEKPKDPPPAKPAEKPKDPPPAKPAEKPKDPPPAKPVEKPKDPPPAKPAEKPKDPPPAKPAEKPKDPPPAKPAEKPKNPTPLPVPVPVPVPIPVQPEPVPVNVCFPVPGYPPAYPLGSCCRQCNEGYSGGPCFHGHGRPGLYYDGCVGRPIYDSYGGGRPCYTSPCDYLSEENASGCSIM